MSVNCTMKPRTCAAGVVTTVVSVLNGLFLLYIQHCAKGISSVCQYAANNVPGGVEYYNLILNIPPQNAQFLSVVYLRES